MERPLFRVVVQPIKGVVSRGQRALGQSVLVRVSQVVREVLAPQGHWRSTAIVELDPIVEFAKGVRHVVRVGTHQLIDDQLRRRRPHGDRNRRTGHPTLQT